MPFYQNDNITTWFYTMIEEQYENGYDEDKPELRQMIVDIPMCTLKEYCENALTTLAVPESIHDPILNSVDWVHLKDLLKEFLKEEEEDESIILFPSEATKLLDEAYMTIIAQQKKVEELTKNLLAQE